MRKIKFLTILSTLLVSFCLNAAHYKTISSTDGLSSNAILCMHQDKIGHIYLGTTDGLNIWNGHEGYTFAAQDGYNYFFGNTIMNIYPFGEHRLYVRTHYGAAIIDTRTNKVEFYHELALGRPIFQDENTMLFLDRDFNIQVFDISNAKLTQHKNAFIPKGVNHRRTLSTTDGRLCIFTDKDSYLVSLDRQGENLSITDITNLNIPCSYISQCYDDSNRHYLITADKRLCVFNADDCSIKEITTIESMPDDTVTGILPSKDGFYISFVKEGLYVLANGKKQLEPTEINHGIFSMIPDREQPVIWIGTDCKGLVRYNMEDNDAYCITYDRLPHDIHMPVRSVYVDKERALWFGTKGDGLFRIRNFEDQAMFDSDNVQKFDTENSRLTNGNIYAITEDSHGFILFGSDGRGLNYWSYDGRHIGKVRGSDKLQKVHSIVEENDSTLWVATEGLGAFRCTYRILNGAPVMTEVKSQEFCEAFNEWADLFSATIQNDSTIWFGSRKNGVLKYNSRSGKSHVIQFPTSSGLAINETFYITSADDMLFATGNGLVIYSPEDQVFHQSEHISKRATHGIVCDNRKNIWVSNNSGIISLDSAYNYRLSFNKFSGLDVLEYSDGACFYDEPGNLVVFGGINGITIIKNNGNRMLSRQTYSPNIYVTHFIQNDKENPIHPMMKKGKLEIPYSKSLFGIKFSLVDHIHYPDYEFRYNIEGYNSEWVTNKSDIIYIHSLGPGDYNLKIAYINKATGYQGKECVLPIHITPPFYRTWLAYCIYSLLLIGIIYIAIRHNQQRYLAMKEKLRKKYLDELNNVSNKTTDTINEELSVQITFILGLCQQIRQAAQNSPYMTDKVNLVEYNIAKINKTLHMFNEYKRISDAVINSAEASFIPVSQTATEILELMRSYTKARNVSLTYEIEDGITTVLNKEAFLTMLYSLIYTAISITKQEKKVNIKVDREKNGNVRVCITLTKDTNVTEEEGDFLLCKKLVEVMNGQISMDFSHLSQELRIEVVLPAVLSEQGMEDMEGTSPLITESINTYNTIIENQLPKNFSSDINPYYIYIVSANRDISSFLGYFLSDRYNVRSFTDNASAVERIEKKAPVAVIYDISSLRNGFTEFLEAVKGSGKEQVIIIALTSSLQTTMREESAKLGADMCISFPFNMNYLRTAIETLQQKQKTVSEYYKSPRSTFTVDEGKIIHNDDKDFIDKVFRTIEENISNPDLSAPMIADLVGISTRGMYRRLENITSKKLHQIIRERRMEMAVNLLSSSKLTIDEIMYRVGYDNRSTFYRNFKEIFEKTPKEYREDLYKDIIKDMTPTNDNRQ